MRRPRRKHTASFKAKVVALKDDNLSIVGGFRVEQVPPQVTAHGRCWDAQQRTVVNYHWVAKRRSRFQQAADGACQNGHWP